jgi:hypothetical protein
LQNAWNPKGGSDHPTLDLYLKIYHRNPNPRKHKEDKTEGESNWYPKGGPFAGQSSVEKFHAEKMKKIRM